MHGSPSAGTWETHFSLSVMFLLKGAGACVKQWIHGWSCTRELGAIHICCLPPKGEGVVIQFNFFMPRVGGGIRKFLIFSDKGERGFRHFLILMTKSEYHVEC